MCTREEIELEYRGMRAPHTSELVNAARTAFPDGLARASYWSDIARVCESVADLFPQRMGFEIRLAPGDTTIDTMFLITRYDQSRQVLARREADAGSGRAGIARLCREWCDPELPLDRQIECMWFEFDASEYGVNSPLPGVWPGDFDFPQAHAAAQRCVGLLRGGPIEPEQASMIRDAFSAPSPRFTTRAFGVSLARRSPQMKLEAVCWQGMDIEPLLSCLEPDMPVAEYEAIKDVVRRLRVALPSLVCGVQIRVDAPPRICGVSFSPSMSPGDTDLVLDVLDELVPVDAARRQCLRAWRGAADGFTRSVVHVKVVYRSGVGLRAKAYLALAYDEFDRMLRRSRGAMGRHGRRTQRGVSFPCARADGCSSL